jgi:hypothetical protein
MTAHPWKRLYGTARWAQVREVQLSMQPYASVA